MLSRELQPRGSQIQLASQLEVIASFSRFGEGDTIWTDWACSRLISPADQQPTTGYADLAYWMGNFVRKLYGNEYDIRSTFDETVRTSSKQAEPISPDEKVMQSKTSRNNNIQLNLLVIIIMMTFRLIKVCINKPT